MKMKTALLLSLAITMLFCSAAFAGGGYYGAIKGGGSWFDTSNPTRTENATGTPTTTTSWDDDGFVLGAAVGWDFMNMDVPVRAEMEYMYHSEIDYNYANSSNSTDFKNEVQVSTVFLNAYWDIHNDTAFTPYIGGGIGLAMINEDYSTSTMTLSDTGNTTTNFAWNIGAGVAVNLTDNLLLDVMYRYENYGSLSDNTITGTTGSVVETLKFDDDLSSHNALVSLRYYF